MIIKTLTCHNVYNYGASLQAFALQEYLKQAGHLVEIIDYLPPYMDKAYRVRFDLYNVSKSSKYYKYVEKMPFLNYLFIMRNFIQHLIKMFRQRNRKKAFDSFTKSKLQLTGQHYTTYEELSNSNMSADVFIVGSDQVWNPLFNNGRDPSFFLEFISKKKKKISYAASFGVSKLDADDSQNISLWLKDFSWISVRESTGVKLLYDMNISADHVIDPVFLLSPDKWRLLCKESMFDYPSGYILVYNLGAISDEIRHCAKTLASHKGFKIIAVEDCKEIKYADFSFKDCGPTDFVKLISNASYVVTNSFHATAFSLIFNKEFFVYIKNTTISRISDVLSMVNLSERMNTVDLELSISWDNVNRMLNDAICSSKTLLNNNLQL